MSKKNQVLTEEMLRKVAGGGSWKDMGERLGYTATYLRARGREWGIKLEKRRAWDALDVKEVCDLWKRGASMAEISQKTGIYYTMVRRILQSRKIKIEKRGRKHDVVALYAAWKVFDGDMKEFAREHGIGLSYLYGLFKKVEGR